MLKLANLRQTATIEEINTKAARGLDKALFTKLATGDWIQSQFRPAADFTIDQRGPVDRPETHATGPRAMWRAGGIGTDDAELHVESDRRAEP